MGIAIAFRTITPRELAELRNATRGQWEQFEGSGGADAGESIDVDKAWDGIHFVLCGRSSSPAPTRIGDLFGNALRSVMGAPAAVPVSATPPDWAPEPGTSALEWIMLKGEDFRANLMDYGQPQIIPAEKVKAVADELQRISEQELRERFNPPQMAAAGVYLDKFWNRDHDQAWEYLIANYRALKAFFEKAAATNKAILRIQC